MIRYALVLAVWLLASTSLLGCSAPVTFTPDSIIMTYGYTDEDYKLKYRFTEEESKQICEILNSNSLETLHVLDRSYYICRIEISATDSTRKLYILRGDRLSVHSTDGSGKTFRIVVKGFFDLIKKRLYGLELEYLGGYPIETISGEILEPGLSYALERAGEELHLPALAYPENVDALRKFQEWYKVNKDKIKWDEKQNKYIVTQ